MNSGRENQSVASPRRRRRPARSCEECRRRKVRCDRKQPCCHCSLTQTACLYRNDSIQVLAPITASHSEKSTDLSALTPLRTPETYSRSIGGISIQPKSGPSSLSTLSSTHGTTSIEEQQSSADSFLRKEAELNELKRRVASLEFLLGKDTPGTTKANRPSTPATSGTPDQPDVAQLPENKWLVLNKSRLFGRSHWTHTSALEVSIRFSCQFVQSMGLCS